MGDLTGASARDAALALLQKNHPGWHVWYVPLAGGGERWCATRHADRAHVEASQPAHLAEYMNAADAEAGNG